MSGPTMIDMRLRVGTGPAAAEFAASVPSDWTVLDVLESLRGDGKPVPPYRHSCHHGSCGTCGAVLNGLPSLMCLTTIGELASPRPRSPGGQPVGPERDASGAFVISVEPLAAREVVAGVACSPSAVFASMPPGAAYLAPVPDEGRASLPADPPGARVDPGAWRPSGRVRFEACIECGLCVSACPVAVPFRGPAGLAAVNRECEKRPERAEAMLALAAEPDGAAACGRALACSRVCPQRVYPGKHIQLLRNALGPGA